MGEKCQWCALLCVICRIGCFRCRQRLCCKEPAAPRPEFSLIAIGLGEAGKSSLLAKLSAESLNDLKPTTGFSVKVIQLPNAILNVKELGGGDNVRKYWSHYYRGAQGILFVVDSSSSDDDVELAASELHKALSHPSLESLPLLVLANKQDLKRARKPAELDTMMGLSEIAHKCECNIQPCSIDAIESAREGLSKLVTCMGRDKEPAQNRL